MLLLLLFLLLFDTPNVAKNNEGGAPLGYFDWPMLTETALNGIESAALFGAAAVAMEFCFNHNLISKFR